MRGQRALAAKVAVVWHWAANRTVPLAVDFEVTLTLTLTGPKIGWVKVPVATPAPESGPRDHDGHASRDHPNPQGAIFGAPSVGRRESKVTKSYYC